jgi:hypothetical protein
MATDDGKPRHVLVLKRECRNLLVQSTEPLFPETRRRS